MRRPPDDELTMILYLSMVFLAVFIIMLVATRAHG